MAQMGHVHINSSSYISPVMACFERFPSILKAHHKLRNRCCKHDDYGRAVLACSALTASCRSILGFGSPHVLSVLLNRSHGLIASKLKMREGQFMPSLLLRSQIALLEPLHSGLTLNIEQGPSGLVHAILHWLWSEECANSPGS